MDSNGVVEGKIKFSQTGESVVEGNWLVFIQERNRGPQDLPEWNDGAQKMDIQGKDEPSGTRELEHQNSSKKA